MRGFLTISTDGRKIMDFNVFTAVWQSNNNHLYSPRMVVMKLRHKTTRHDSSGRKKHLQPMRHAINTNSNNQVCL